MINYVLQKLYCITHLYYTKKYILTINDSAMSASQRQQLSSHHPFFLIRNPFFSFTQFRLHQPTLCLGTKSNLSCCTPTGYYMLDVLAIYYLKTCFFSTHFNYTSTEKIISMNNHYELMRAFWFSGPKNISDLLFINSIFSMENSIALCFMMYYICIT